MSKFWNESYKFSSKICSTLHFSVHQMVAYNIILELMVVFKLSILMELGICATKIIEYAFVKRRVSRKLFILKKVKKNINKRHGSRILKSTASRPNHTSYRKVYFNEFVQNYWGCDMGMIIFDLHGGC